MGVTMFVYNHFSVLPVRFCQLLFFSNFCSLQQFPMKENRTGAQIIEFLTKRVNALGAKQCGTFLVDCETYASIPQLGMNYYHVYI